MKFILLAVFLFFVLVSTGQVKIWNMRLRVPDSNLLYVNAPNDLDIYGLKPTGNVKVVVKDADVMDREADSILHFIVYPRKQGKVVLSLYAQNKLVLKKEYTAVYLNLPRAQLGSISDSIATRAKVYNSPGLFVVFPGCLFIGYYQISAFDLTILDSTGQVKEVFETNRGNSITRSQKESFSFLEAGDQLVFDNIRVTGSDTRNFKLPSFRIMIQ